MLRADRSSVPVPAALRGAECPAAIELEKARRHYRDFDPDDLERSKSFEFSVYKNDTVKEALHALFHGKCAYCESSYQANAPMEVEHYRPKLAITVKDNGTTRTIKPGYWWLAAEWTNLLPSCIDCNRQRYQDLGGDDVEKAGKASLFPLADEDKRARTPEDLDAEQPLLLDPCRQDPGKVLSFVFDRETTVAILREAEGVTDLDRRRATTSIQVFGLNRSGLRSARGEHFLRAWPRFQDLKLAATDFEQQPKSEQNRQRLADKIREVYAYRHASSQYATLVRQIADPLLESLKRVLQKFMGLELAPSPDTAHDLIERFLKRYPAAALPPSGPIGLGG